MHEGLKLYFEYNHLAPLKKKKKKFYFFHHKKKWKPTQFSAVDILDLQTSLLKGKHSYV